MKDKLVSASDAFSGMFLHHYLEPYESIEWIIGIAAADVSMAFA